MTRATAAVLAAVVLFLAATLPGSPDDHTFGTTDPTIASRTLAGAYHIHTTRSDGAGDKRAIAAAAARAGLTFLILTDHGDATRPADPPEYIDGVLCLDAVEISTNGGHYVALGMPPAPYPLGGEASAVVEDVARLGGFGIVAHPDHPRGELAWTDWSLPVDGLEWINADVAWRNESILRLARTPFDYLFRPAASLAALLDRPAETIARWDSLSRTRPVVALAAVDAHGGGPAAEGGAPFGIGPGYEASFGSLSNRVVLDAPPTGSAVADARLLLAAIRQGRVYSVVAALAPNVLIDWHQERGFSFDGKESTRAEVQSFRQGDRSRLEIQLAGAPGDPAVPWVLTNWSGGAPPPTSAPAAAPSRGTDPLQLASSWRIEKDPRSVGSVSTLDDAITVDYRLAEGDRVSQFVAAAADLDRLAPFRAITFRGRASQPMRVSVQLRFAPDDTRWVRSVYLDPSERDVVVDAAALVDADGGGDARPDLRSARSLLLVVDLVNARPGAEGSFTISDMRLVR